MSTRSIIARPTPAGFAGRYCHWDGYPSGVGRTLYTLRNGHFHRDTTALLRVLIDEHPAGWSIIVDADFSLDPRWIDDDHQIPPDHPDRLRPRCYCHGDRNEAPMLLTYPAGRDGLSDAEFAYVIDGRTHAMQVYCVVGAYGQERLRPLATDPLAGPAPLDWGRRAR